MIIVSAGHVDHGKTALIHALTGTDTTHLPEEKKRGMTIDLGYAYLTLNDKQVIGFIDVPGHERFLSNMLAGVSGVRYAMLVIAADEGIKPQTEEHLKILELLDFEQIIVVISKADKANAQQLADLQAQIIEYYPVLDKSAVFIVSVVNGRGIEALKVYLTGLLDHDYVLEKPFRYAIDRIFHLKGTGKIVTGTAFAGKIAIDDHLFLSSQLKHALRVKNIHAQNHPSQQGYAGQRLAINLVGEQGNITRGSWLFSHSQAYCYDRITVLLNPISMLKESQAVHIFHAASHTIGQLILLEKNITDNRQQILAELVLQQPLFLAIRDKLILRSGDNKVTLAGAKVLEVGSPLRYKRNPQRLAYLWQLEQSKTVSERLVLYLQQGCIEQNMVCWAEQLSKTALLALQRDLDIYLVDQWLFSQAYQIEQQQRLLQTVLGYHQQHPDQIGLSKARLQRIAALKQPTAVIYYFIQQLLDQEKLAQTRGWIHSPDHKIMFTDDEWLLWQQVEAVFFNAQGQAIWVRDLANILDQPESIMRNLLYKAGKLGYLTAVIKDRFFLTETIYAYADKIKQHIEQQGGISVNELRDQLKFGRKMTVQLIEYFDKCGFLWRRGNKHFLRDTDVFK